MSGPDEPRHDEPHEGGPSDDAAAAGPKSLSVPDDLANRTTVALPTQRGGAGIRPGATRRRAPVAVAAAVNALWAGVLGFVPLLGILAAVTLIGPARPPLHQTTQYALAVWLLSHGVPLQVAGAPLTVIPLLVTAFIWWRLVRAGRNAVRAVRDRGVHRWRAVAAIGVTIALVYGLLGAGSAVLITGHGLAIADLGALAPPVRAGLTLAVFAGLAAAFGAGAATGAARSRWDRIPAVVRDGVRGAVIAVYLLLAAGALATGVAIAVAGGKAETVLHSYHAGVTGQAGLIVVCLVYAPNFAVWASAFLAGPGFTLTVVPPLPIFAALPDRAVTGFGQFLLGVPVAVGVGAGVALVRKAAVARRVLSDWRRTLPIAVVAGLVTAAILALVSFLAAGSLGTGLLIGQVGWQYPAISGVGVGAGVLVGLTGARLIGLRRRL
jgi:hypothetical protein